MSSIISSYLKKRRLESPQVPDKTRSHVFVVDGTNQFIRAFCASNTLSHHGTHVGGIEGFLWSLGYCVSLLKPTKIVIVFDGDNGSRKRKAIHPEYKQGRGGSQQKVTMFDSIEDENDAKIDQIIRLIDYLRCLPVQIVCMDDVEADDIVALYAKHYESEGYLVTIGSSDKDYLQVINENIRVYRTSDKTTYDAAKVMEKYGVHPANFLNYLSLIGDTVDGLAGVPGMGPKTVLSCFPELTGSEMVSIDDLLACAAAQPKKKTCQNVILNEHVLRRNHKLIDLHHPLMSDAEKKQALQYLTVESKSNRGKLSPYEFSLIIKNDKIPFTDPMGWVSSRFGYLV